MTSSCQLLVDYLETLIRRKFKIVITMMVKQHNMVQNEIGFGL